LYPQNVPIEKEKEDLLRKKSNDTITGWKMGGVFSINSSQISLINWADGGQRSFSVNSLLRFYAKYKNKLSYCSNNFDFGYGIMQQGKKKLRKKTDDRIEYTTIYGRYAAKNWYYSSLINLKTQASPGYNYPNDSVIISDFFAPAYIVGAIGMDFKPNDHLNIFFSPFMAKITIVNNRVLANAGSYGVDKAIYFNNQLIKNGKKIRKEYGGYIRSMYLLKINKNLTIQTKVDLFSNYKENPQNIDINTDMLVSLKVNKFFSITWNVIVKYDDDVIIKFDNNEDGKIDKDGPGTQFKEILGIGFALHF